MPLLTQPPWLFPLSFPLQEKSIACCLYKKKERRDFIVRTAIYQASDLHTQREEKVFPLFPRILLLQIFQALEHPLEIETLGEIKDLVKYERENFVHFIFNGSWNSVTHRLRIDEVALLLKIVFFLQVQLRNFTFV